MTFYDNMVDTGTVLNKFRVGIIIWGDHDNMGVSNYLLDKNQYVISTLTHDVF
jgi:uncharacterized membrane protein YciS (DUF1049 family)